MRYFKWISLNLFFFALLNLNIQAQNLDKNRLLELIAYSDSLFADEIIVIYKGQEVLYWKDPSCSFDYMNTASLVKSLLGLSYGILIEQQKIKSIDEKVCNYLPEWASGCEQGVTIRHLLQMTAGFNTAQGEKNIMRYKDMNTHVMGMELDREPGRQWAYSNESVQLLGIILERASGVRANDFMKTYLFDPLDMPNTSLIQDDAGNDIVFGGCKTTLRELSNVALMLRENGAFRGKRIVPETWIQQMMNPPAETPHYSLLWWNSSSNTPQPWIAAAGGEGNWLKYFPELDLIYLRHQHCDPATGWPSTHGGKLIKKVREIVK